VLIKYKGKRSVVYIPDGIKRIYQRAFACCYKIKTIFIPDSVSVIEDDAFTYCTLLEKIVFPKSIKFLEDNALYGCNSLECLVAPSVYVMPIKNTAHKHAAVIGFCENQELFADHDIIDAYKKYIASQRRQIYSLALKRDCAEFFQIVAELGKINVDNFEEEFLNPAMEAKANECVKFLLSWKNDNISFEDVEKKFKRELARKPTSIAEIKKDWYYIKELSKTITLYTYYGKQTTVYIPEKVGRTPVTALGFRLFSPNTMYKDYTPVEHVYIHDGVTFIGERVFEDNKSITIHAPKNSFAAKYAKLHNIPLVEE
jgi:hypothetical protein